MIEDIEIKPTCTRVVLPTNTTITPRPTDNTNQKTPVCIMKRNQHFPTNFKKYDLTRSSQGCHGNAHKFVTYIYLPWQVIQIFSDKTFNEAEVLEMHDTLYETAYLVTKVFNVTRPTFLSFIGKIPKKQTVYILDDQELFYKTSGKSRNTCWLYGTRNFYVNKHGKCGSYMKLLSILYTLYMNDGYLMKGAYGPYWWKLGLCYYTAGYCYENTFKGKLGLNTLFNYKQESPEDYVYGSIIHGFLDSTPALRKYHIKMFNILNKNPRNYHYEYNKLIREIVDLYGDTFNKSYYCKMYDTYNIH